MIYETKYGLVLVGSITGSISGKLDKKMNEINKQNEEVVDMDKDETEPIITDTGSNPVTSTDIPEDEDIFEDDDEDEDNDIDEDDIDNENDDSPASQSK